MAVQSIQGEYTIWNGVDGTDHAFFCTVKNENKSYGYPQPKIGKSQEITGMGRLKIFLSKEQKTVVGG